MTARVLTGDCRTVLATLEANSIDACVTDPPYGLEFMGKEWDRLDTRQPGDTNYTTNDTPGGRSKVRYSSSPSYGGSVGKEMQTWHETWAREVYRVLKPGAHLLAFSGTRTSHRMVCAIEDAGFEIRDCLMWIYGQGFPKSLDVSKALDKAAGAEREVVGQSAYAANRTKLAPPIGTFIRNQDDRFITAPATDLAKEYAGYGTALKPSYEPIVLARKPLIGSVAANVTAYGTGALNVDGCRIGTDEDLNGGGYSGGTPKTMFSGLGRLQPEQYEQPSGRWPANLILGHHPDCREVGTKRVKASGFERSRPPRQTGMVYGEHGDTPFNGHADADGYETVPAWDCHPDCAVALLDAMSGERTSGGPGHDTDKATGLGWGWDVRRAMAYGDTGGASRFFYTSKSSRAERNKGLLGMPEQSRGEYGEAYAAKTWIDRKDGRGRVPVDAKLHPSQNHHPTVKPVDLMQWLVRLVTPKGGTVLDPFLGSGSTGIAADREGFDFIGIEQDPEYAEIARKRIVGDCPLFTTLAAD